MYPKFKYKMRFAVSSIFFFCFLFSVAGAQTAKWQECRRIEFPETASLLVPNNWTVLKDGEETVNGGIILPSLLKELKKPNEVSRYVLISGGMDSNGLPGAWMAFSYLKERESQESVRAMGAEGLAKFDAETKKMCMASQSLLGCEIKKWIGTRKQKLGETWVLVTDCEFKEIGSDRTEFLRGVSVYGNGKSFALNFSYRTDRAGEYKTLIDRMTDSVRVGVPVTAVNASGVIEIGRTPSASEMVQKQAEPAAMKAPAQKVKEDSDKAVTESKRVWEDLKNGQESAKRAEEAAARMAEIKREQRNVQRLGWFLGLIAFASVSGLLAAWRKRKKAALPPVRGTIGTTGTVVCGDGNVFLKTAVPVVLCGVIGAAVLCFGSWYITENEKQKLLAAGGDFRVVEARGRAIGIKGAGGVYTLDTSEYDSRLQSRMTWWSVGGFVLGGAAGFLLTRRRGERGGNA